MYGYPCLRTIPGSEETGSECNAQGEHEERCSEQVRRVVLCYALADDGKAKLNWKDVENVLSGAGSATILLGQFSTPLVVVASYELEKCSLDGLSGDSNSYNIQSYLPFDVWPSDGIFVGSWTWSGDGGGGGGQ